MYCTERSRRSPAISSTFTTCLSLVVARTIGGVWSPSDRIDRRSWLIDSGVKEEMSRGLKYSFKCSSPVLGRSTISMLLTGTTGNLPSPVIGIPLLWPLLLAGWFLAGEVLTVMGCFLSHEIDLWSENPSRHWEACSRSMPRVAIQSIRNFSFRFLL